MHPHCLKPCGGCVFILHDNKFNNMLLCSYYMTTNLIICCYPDINECIPSFDPCINGICTNSNGSYQCACVAGYTGVNCQTNINECHSNPCLHSSTCIDGINMYTCNCSNGYTGVNCQTNIDECTSSPCLNSGTCTDGINEYSCICANAYTGLNCEADIDECQSSPCQHNGRCEDLLGAFNCNCSGTGYTGVTCGEGMYHRQSCTSGAHSI